MTRRAGFTLVELVASLFVSSVVVGSLASCIALVVQSVPSTSDPQERLRTLQSIAGRIASDVRFATEVAVVDSRQLELVVSDRDGDAQPEDIVYAWSGTAGEALTRQQNAEATVALFTAVDRVAFGWSTDAALAVSSVGTLAIDMEAGSSRVELVARCLNVPPPVVPSGGSAPAGAVGTESTPGGATSESNSWFNWGR
ncbi:MAG: prepilin-type N-terminal cleavage/methylation domain-containing protein [Planctomycetota bacterium]